MFFSLYHDHIKIFFRLLQFVHIPDDAYLVTIDVESLYPSIPQSECLSIIYEQMHARKHLVLFNPNLIIKLLHINISSNFFEFGPLIFQQIKGTAMGAAFSPTIANIYLSTILQRFVSSQPKQPYLLKRYIDDIFLIWQHSSEDLREFLTALNQFHPSLKYTWTFSQTSVDYLDITIYKGPLFQITNYLDTKTFQKPQNLYQYLHYSSHHPPSTFKGIIVGETIRYVRTNSTEDSYLAILEQFKHRLYNRLYPPALVNKTVQLIKYTDRQNYLKEPVPSYIPRLKPIFKCLPPPQFVSLKAIVLQHYHLIQKFAPRPRFIPLRHKTLSQEVVRAKLYPTDEQFIDILLATSGHIVSPRNPNSTSFNLMPKLYSFQISTKPCKRANCTTCRHLNCEKHFRSSINKRTHPIRHSFSCTSSNVIYLITCLKCKKQYVGRTTNQLKERINRHHSSITNDQTRYVSIHFNFSDHRLDHLSVQAIDTAPTIAEQKRLERFWILTLETYVPKGLNVTIGSSKKT